MVFTENERRLYREVRTAVLNRWQDIANYMVQRGDERGVPGATMERYRRALLPGAAQGDVRYLRGRLNGLL